MNDKYEYICEKCRQRITHKKSVLRHRRTCMIQSKDFKCEKCVKVFNRLDSLKRHSKLWKNGLVKKEIQSEVCFKIFESNWLLKRHLKSCKAEKCLECLTCDKKFTTLRSLQLHQEKANCDMVEDDFVATMIKLPHQNFEGRNEILDESNIIIVEDRQQEPLHEVYAVNEQIETIEEENSQSEVSKSNYIMFIFATDRICVISGFSLGI